LLGCNTPAKDGSNFETGGQSTKTVGNVSFIFPSTGYAFENRILLIDECLAAIESNCSLIKLPKFYRHYNCSIFTSRQEMKKYTA
jgi:hypothetical protein